QHLRIFAHHFGRLLVGAQTLERRMAKRAVVAPFRERDFRDEIGFDPMCSLGFVPAWRIHEWRLALLAFDELLVQCRERVLVETGADLARVAELAAVVDAQQQSTESGARTLRLGKAADHHFLAARALHLDPVARPLAIVVERIGALADGAFEAQGAGLLEELFAVADCLRSDANGADAVADYAPQEPLALRQGHATQVVAIEMDDI